MGAARRAASEPSLLTGVHIMRLTTAQRESAILAECVLRFMALVNMHSNKTLQITLEYLREVKATADEHDAEFLQEILDYITAAQQA
jgi:hypothetical protein